MLWASDLKGRDGKPAVLLLACQRTPNGVLTEAAYVSTELTAGTLTGVLHESKTVSEELSLVFGDWPLLSVPKWLHPNSDTPDHATSGNKLYFSITGG